MIRSEKEMGKTPGEFEPRKPLSKEERDARKALRDGDAKSALTEHANTARAFDKNRERLRAERLAREAAEPPPAPKNARGKACRSGRAQSPPIKSGPSCTCFTSEGASSIKGDSNPRR